MADSQDGWEAAGCERHVYHMALSEASVPTKLHVYAHGGHAFGLWRTNDPITEWPQLVEKCCGPLA
jgi:acetyl esterase/lipase